MNGEKRSRSGVEATYDGMPIAWKSSSQKCKNTEYCEDLVATSSGEAEVYAASDAAKLGLHLKHMCEELGIPVEEKVKIHIDAGAAMGFINNTAAIGRMKHIDLRAAWIGTLRDKSIEFIRIPGEDNRADFYTKIHTGPKVKEVLERSMGKL